mgnify:CR=1 FL=1
MLNRGQNREFTFTDPVSAPGRRRIVLIKEWRDVQAEVCVRTNTISFLFFVMSKDRCIMLIKEWRDVQAEVCGLYFFKSLAILSFSPAQCYLIAFMQKKKQSVSSVHLQSVANIVAILGGQQPEPRGQPAPVQLLPLFNSTGCSCVHSLMLCCQTHMLF